MKSQGNQSSFVKEVKRVCSMKIVQARFLPDLGIAVQILDIFSVPLWPISNWLDSVGLSESAAQVAVS